MNFCGKALSLLLILSVAVGCSEKTVTTSYDNRNSPTYEGPAEETYCSTVATFSDSVTISASAEFEYRPIVTLSAYNVVLDFIAGSEKPIRRAEVRAKNSAGNTIQCGETDNSGNFSLTLPKNTGNYTLEVNSRANNSYANVTVFNKPASNQFYSLQTTVSSSASGSIGAMTAPADGTVIAGAFNILDQIISANEYLIAQVGSGNCPNNGCIEFSPTNKLKVYWEAGFNPSSYDGTGSTPLSYYIPGFQRLFILGGLNGDVDNSDTDHFDNTIILHEYGHFLEDVLLKSDNPGGSHNGNSIVDPRLAWSEGFSNFIQAAIKGEPSYNDTFGNRDGTAGTYFARNLETGVSGEDISAAGAGDNSKGYGTDGEGIFREFSITRTLWDVIDTNNDGESVSNDFEDLWTVLTSTSSGVKDNKWAFMDMGLVMKLQDELSGRTDWSALRGLERQIASRGEYAQYLEPDDSCADADYYVSLTPKTSSDTPSTDYFNNHDFYHLSLGSTSAGAITIEFNDADGAGIKADLELAIHRNGARITSNVDRIRLSNEENASSDPGVTESQTLNFPSLSAGDYLLQVFSWDGSGSQVRYALKFKGEKLCRKDP